VAAKDSYSTTADQPLTISEAQGVLANDMDANGDVLQALLVTNPSHGTLGLNVDGSFSYTPAADYTGADSFTYRISDGAANSNVATVGLTITSGTALDPVTFAVIGDYGVNNSNELAVANLVKSLNPEFIVTVGDNTYGSVNTPDTAIGKYYSDYIGNYQGVYGPGSETNRFFPALGNHDWTDGGGIQAYLDFFTLPESSRGNERYYDFIKGPVHFFVVDSDTREPDGHTATSAQASWLKAGLTNSVTPWQFVVMHHSPYSSSDRHGPEEDLQWPYEAWGADAIFTGHDHTYERLLKDDNGDGKVVPYFVNGIGGAPLYPFSSSPDPDSAFRYNAAHGGMLVKATETELAFETWSVANGGSLIDSYLI
jgi:VCBS repeat-containing protein